MYINYNFKSDLHYKLRLRKITDTVPLISDTRNLKGIIAKIKGVRLNPKFRFNRQSFEFYLSAASIWRKWLKTHVN